MDTSSVSRAIVPSDVVTPHAAAKSHDSEMPAEKTVVQIKETSAGNLPEHRQENQNAQSESQRERNYELRDRVFIYSVSDEQGFKIVQIPSEQAVKLRAYLAQEQAAKNQRREQADDEHLDIVA